MRTEVHKTKDNSVCVSLHFDTKGLTLSQTPFGVIVKLEDLNSTGEPGTPALPRTQLRLALPEPFWPGSLKIVEDKWELVTDAGTLVVPAQQYRPGGGGEFQGSHPAGDTALHCAGDCTCRTIHRPDRSPVDEKDKLPALLFTPPIPEAYVEAAKNPPPIVQAVRIETIGANRIAVVEVTPIRYTLKGQLELCTHVQLAVDAVKTPCMTDKDQNEAVAEFSKIYGKDVDKSRVLPEPERFISGSAEASRLRDIAISQVINPIVIGSIRRDWPIIELRSDYLIITDDVTWDPVAITPGVSRPGLIKEFERLAEAKRARGISTRVVSITDIVAGRWGNFRAGSRDLQEVIRRFLKDVRTRWAVNWLLLGGDTSIVPVRRVAGALEGGIDPPLTVNPPANNKSFWTGSHLRIHAVNPGTWWGASTDNLLVRPDTGALIRYDAAGTSSSTSPGWYFTTADDYTTRSATPTNFVRVEGPSSLVNAGLQFIYAWNTLPTDFYYASLTSWVVRTRPVRFGPVTFQMPYVYTPPHDWDAIGNGVYGQFRLDGSDIDGVNLQTELSVGRAPVETAAEANTFVNKTLAYERLGRLGWRAANRQWPRNLVLAAADWGSRAVFWPTGNAVPADGQYSHDATQSRSLLKRDAAPDSFAWDVIARITEDDRRVLPYKTDANPVVRGWYFATSATDSTPSRFQLNIFGTRISWPTRSPWVIIHGSLAERTPQLYEFNPRGADGSMADQEILRKQIRSELPGIDRHQRFYEDEFDLPFIDRIAAPVDFLTVSNLRSALDAAPHIVSLSGHGNSNGCCSLSVNTASNLTNGPLGFIAYADSCLTNQFDEQDSMSEALIKNPNGGAVAYIGNTRFSWIGVGDNFQRAFFHRLTATRQLGLLNDSRIATFGTSGFIAGADRWAIYTLNLLGDPELRVYRAAIPPLRLPLTKVKLRKPFIRILGERKVPSGPPVPGDPSPVKGALVYVRQGPKLEFTGVTDADGVVFLPEGRFEKGELEVTASHDEYAVVADIVQIEG
ncbi:hypothetical protein HYQ45_002034 [Verticillium longisporum]|uniref:Gingipain domain-containing protein n=1 Tax=Verticillium longisporum TaxID=100787 RepID=A0A8I3A0X3_VERLO|nr:hypothetical protein HYQ45_002034 [Verticillium longisporum]